MASSCFQTRMDSRPEDLFLAHQVHGTRVLRVTKFDCVEEIAKQEADALWTTEPRVRVGVKTADCVPVLLTLREGLCVAAIHVGWRGAAAGIVAKTLQRLIQTLGVQAQDFEAQIGPCIGFDVYEVGPEVAEQVDFRFLKPGQGDRFYLDLRNWVAQQLRDLGVQSIQISRACTLSEREKYYSARRGDAGRQYSWVVLL